MTTTTASTSTSTSLLLPARTGWTYATPMLPVERIARRSAAAAASAAALDAAAEAAVLGGTREAALAAMRAAGLPRAMVAKATRAVAKADTVRGVAAVADAALRDHRIAQRVASAAPAARWGVACRATKAGDGGPVAHAKRAAAAMRAAGATAPSDPRRALEAEERRIEARRIAAVPETVETVSSRLNLGTTVLPRALAARLATVERAFEATFRAPSNAAQRGHNLETLAALRGRFDQSASREWVKYSARESHQATVVASRLTVGLAVLLRPELAVVDGILTVDLRDSQIEGGIETLAAKWLRQGRGTAVEVSKGYLAVAHGEAAHGPTREAAAKTLARRIAREAEEAAEREAQGAAERERAALVARVEAAAGGPIAGIAAMPARRIAVLAAALDAPVRVGDSRVAGNCDAGTADWCQRHLGLTPEALGTATVAVRSVLAAVVRSGGDRASLALAACVAAASR